MFDLKLEKSPFLKILAYGLEVCYGKCSRRI